MTLTSPAAPSAAAKGADAALDDAARKRLDAIIAGLAAHEKNFGAMTVADRAALVGRLHESVADAAEEWVTAAARIKRLDADSPYVGEEWISGPYAVLASLAMVRGSLTAISQGRSPLAGKKFGSAPGNRVSVTVLPANLQEATLFNGFHCDVWMPPGTTEASAKAAAGLGELTPAKTAGVGLVLGAGNITSIPPLDVLYELLANNRISLLKLNPVLADLEPAYRKALAPLIDAGLLEIVQGGGEVGSYLAHHSGISHVHITGSAATHDVVVWGPGDAGRDRKRARTPLLKKEITSELGGVSPIIIVPGRWSKADLTFQAEHVATQRLHNGGYNCIAGQIVVLSSDWDQREAFLTELRAALDRAPVRAPWYPGSDDRVNAAAKSHPKAERHASDTRLLVEITADDDASMIETTEYFSPVLGVVDLPGTGIEFLTNAVSTVNTDFLGTLGANVLIDPSTRKKLGTAFMDQIAELRYGTVAINTWTGFGYLSAGAPWGGFPGATLTDVQSGIGVVHNALLIASPERAVAYGPFRPFPRSWAGGEGALFPKPPWFVTARSARITGKRLVHYAKKPSWLRMPAVFGSAFRA
ncbi:MAG TPA: aldehyde dehydrogenase family protein [Galbitalea sp.]